MAWTVEAIDTQDNSTGRVTLVWEKSKPGEFTYSESVNFATPELIALADRANVARLALPGKVSKTSAITAAVRAAIEGALNK